MSADDLSASGRWARDPYVQALEEQLKKLGFKDDELKTLRKEAKAKKGGSRVQPLTFEEVRARRIEAYLKAEQDPRFTIPVEVSLRSVDFSMPVVLGAKPPLKTVLNSNPLGKIAINRAETAPTSSSRATSCVPTQAIKAWQKTKEKPAQRDKHMLHDVSARFEAGSLTLVLGPPQSGKSCLLRCIAGLLRPAGKSSLKAEEISFNGDPVYPAITGGEKRFEPTRVAAYMDEIDRHSPSLTVEETMRFAYQTLGAGAQPAPPDDISVLEREAAPFMPASHTLESSKIDFVLQGLGLAHVRHTVVGNATKRGVSGGQRRRVTVGEMLMGNSRVWVGDEISTGLDSQTTFEIIKGFKTFSAAFGQTTVISLLQPPPETFNLFEQVVLLCAAAQKFTRQPSRRWREGETFDFRTGYEVPARKDVCDYCIEVCSNVGGDYATSAATPTTPVALEAAWRGTTEAEAAARALETTKCGGGGCPCEWPEAHQKRFELGFGTYAKWCFKRRLQEIKGDPSYYKARMCQSIFMGLFTGSLYWQTSYKNFSNKLGFFFMGLMYVGLGSIAQVPGDIADREIMYRHADASFYPPVAYALAMSFFRVPWIILEALVYTNIMYWLAGLTVGGYGGFLAMTALLGLAMSSYFQCLALLAPNALIATPIAGLNILFFVTFSGFAIRKDTIPDGWMYWISPVAWAWRGCAVNEFNQDLYDKQTLQEESGLCTRGSSGTDCPKKRDGTYILDNAGTQTEFVWLYYGIIVLALYWIGFFLLYVFLARTIRHNPPPIVVMEEDEEDEGLAEAMSSRTPPRPLTMTERSEKQLQSDDGCEAIPYEPITLAFRDIRYTVMVPPKDGQRGVEPYALELLQGVTGFAKPATLTALMGSSGAGKTTLLDVIAGRKTGGIIQGEVTLNGHPKDQRTFTRVSGYVEQLDVHSPESTVREAALFSAALRLEPEHAKCRERFVDGILERLELTNIKDRQVGKLGSPDALSFEQRKRLTMAVELAANPAILFLDEPTSGLDSRSAIVVARAIQSVSSTGRSVICTIHQPSFALFSIFDRLLLLKTGGRTVYFGDLGENSTTLTNYLTTACEDLDTNSLPHELPDGANPATWMLSACVAPEDFAGYYAESPLAKENEQLTEAAATKAPGSEPVHFSHVYAMSFCQQFNTLLKRQFLNYWRSPSYNVTRGMVCIIVAIIFGTILMKPRPGSVNTWTDSFSFMGIMYLDTFFMAIIFYTSAIPNMVSQRDSYYREKASRMYQSAPYALTFGIAEFPYLVAYTFLHCGILWGFIDFFPQEGYGFWYYVCYFFLFVSLLTFMAQFLAVAMPNQQVASSLGMAYLSMTANVSGFSITPQDIPGGWMFHVGVEIKILRRVRAESPRRPPRRRHDACSTAWRCRFLAARRSQHGRVIAEK